MYVKMSLFTDELYKLIIIAIILTAIHTPGSLQYDWKVKS